MLHVRTSPNRIRRRARVLGLLASAAPALCAAGAEPASAAPTPVTLEEAIRRGLEHAPLVSQATGGTRTAAAAERTAFGAYLPTVSANAGTSLSSSQRFN